MRFGTFLSRHKEGTLNYSPAKTDGSELLPGYSTIAGLSRTPSTETGSHRCVLSISLVCGSVRDEGRKDSSISSHASVCTFSARLSAEIPYIYAARGQNMSHVFGLAV